MSIRVVDRVDGWDQRPFSGGYDALHDLADEEFSGVVRAGGAELYMTLGTAVAVRRGSIEDFESASGTVFSAPVPALPLLAVMQEEDADVRAQYYTEETPISEVDGTLSNGGFTGFVELAENVLSGDYFLVYHGGESMSVAFVGNNEELITDDEAFQTADDEVGIYKVRQVDVDPIEIPEPAGGESSAAQPAAAATTEGAAEAAETADEETDDDTPTGDAPDDEPAAEGDGASEATEGDETADTEPTAESADEPSPEAADATDEADGETTAAGSADATASTETAEPTETRETAETTETAETVEPTESTGTAEPTETRETAEPTETTGASRSESAGQSTGGTGTRSSGSQEPAPGGTGPGAGTGSTRSTGGPAADAGSGSSGRSTGSAADLETRSIPSLDPDQTHAPERSTRQPTAPEPATRGGGAGQGGRPSQASQQQARDQGQPARQGAQPQQGEPEGGAEPRDGGQAGGAGTAAEGEPTPAQDEGAAAESDGAAAETSGTAGASGAALEELEDELADREAEIERLESELETATSERDDLQADLEAVREERDELATKVERLEEELDRLEEEFGAATDTEQRMTPAEAIEGTNLFVEYDSKGNATLENAHGGSESQEEVAENLRLGVHTEFDERAVAVGGQDFDEFLRNTLHYRFAEWVIAKLLFEVRDTGHADALPDLYDAIPEIRRVEFNGAVDVEYVEDGQEKGGRERFDVIFRHRMGDPLVVANLNDSRDPATGSMMESIVTAAERVGQTEDALSSAFLVTSSFFESEALETVSEATQGGLLSRDSRKSFVNLSRKAGYHLCLVAARDGNFHMEVPEL